MTTPIRASLSQALLKPNPSQASNAQTLNPLAAQKAFFQNIATPKPNLSAQLNINTPTVNTRSITPATYTLKDIEKALAPTISQNQPIETILRPGSRLNIVV